MRNPLRNITLSSARTVVAAIVFTAVPTLGLVMLVEWNATRCVAQSPSRPDAVYWTSPKPDMADIAGRYRLYAGPMNSEDRATLKKANPTSILIDYHLVRYLHSWSEYLWAQYCDSTDIDVEEGYLHTDYGNRINAVDSPGWCIANITSEVYRSFAVQYCVKRMQGINGMMIDIPTRTMPWSLHFNPVECTQEEYDNACLLFLMELKDATKGKLLFVNVANLWSYERWPDATIRALIRASVALSDGVMFQTGGEWSFSELGNKIILEAEHPANVFSIKEANAK